MRRIRPEACGTDPKHNNAAIANSKIWRTVASTVGRLIGRGPNLIFGSRYTFRNGNVKPPARPVVGQLTHYRLHRPSLSGPSRWDRPRDGPYAPFEHSREGASLRGIQDGLYPCHWRGSPRNLQPNSQMEIAWARQR